MNIFTIPKIAKSSTPENFNQHHSNTHQKKNKRSTKKYSNFAKLNTSEKF